MKQTLALVLTLSFPLGACGPSGPSQAEDVEENRPPSWEVVQGAAERFATIDGLAGPESVRYDPEQDVWFVGNFNGDGGERDGNGFVTRVDAATGQIAVREFAVGTDEHPLHAARGMFVTGDTLLVADIDGVHGFHRETGAQLFFVDFTPLEPGFLNDIARAGSDGPVYVTDTGRSAVYRLDGHTPVQVLQDPALGGPNGITWDETRSVLVLMPWQPDHRVHTWSPGSDPVGFGPNSTPGRLDGVEPIDRRLLLASQTDSSLHLLDAGGSRRVIRVAGAPADIGVDTRRRRVAVPYVSLDRVDIWELPEG